MARVFHIAVNLLLIVVMTVQPGLVYGLKRDCSVGASSGFTCTGCGCCKVQSETENCPCCSGEATNDEGGCCGNEHPVEASCEDPFEGVEIQKGPLPEDVTSPCTNDDPQVQAAGDTALATACHCIVAPEPLNLPMPRSPASELRDVSAVSIAYVANVAASERSSLSSTFELAQPPIEPHFSQIAFCVWRL